MSEHELWNELGNLYYLSGSYNQAVHAYNRAIQLESDFGKPFSNLALIYTKQAKYEDAIHLYKKSLDLLTNDAEKAITWNRLGNVYRQLKNYREAVVAYQSADELRSNIVEYDEQPNQMLYVSSESETLPYEVVEEQQGYQNHSADYMLDVEPEFDEASPEFEPVEAELQVSEIQCDQNTLSDWKIKNIAEPVSIFPAGDVDIAEPVTLEESASTLLESATIEKLSQVESETKVVDEPGEEVLPEDSLIEMAAQEPGGNVLSEVDVHPKVDEDSGITLGEESLSVPETGTYSEEDAQEILPAELFAQTEDSVEALPEELTSVLSEAVAHLDDEDPAVEIVESLPDESDSTTSETDNHPDNDMSEDNTRISELITQVGLASEIVPTDLETSIGSDEESPEKTSELMDPTAQAEDESDKNKYALSKDTVQQTVSEEEKVEAEISAEEKKLAEQIEINPRNATTWEALGTLYKTAGRYEKAIQAFEQAVSIAPGTVSYYHNLGLVYSVSGNNEGAFNAFQKVLELDPNHSLTHASLGGYYKKIGLEELAQQHIGKAMKRIYESENEYNRACLDAICGNLDQAVALLRTALEKKQTYIDWILHDPDLDSLRDDDHFKQLISEFSK